MIEEHNIRLAPLRAYPEGLVREAVGTFAETRDKWREAESRVSAYTSRDAVEAARAADARAALDAAKEGKDPGAVGTPGESALAAQAAEAQRAAATYATLTREAWSLAAQAIREAAPAAAAHWREERDQRAQVARATAERLRDAQRQYVNALAAVAYFDRVSNDARAEWGGYGPGVDLDHVNVDNFLAGLDRVSQVQDGPSYRQAAEDLPAQEAAAPGVTVPPKPRRKRTRKPADTGAEVSSNG